MKSKLTIVLSFIILISFAANLALVWKYKTRTAERTIQIELLKKQVSDLEETKANLQQPARRGDIDRVAVTPDLSKGKTEVILVIGQSNASGRGRTLNDYPNEHTFNFYNEKFYNAKDPMLGNDGNGSAWPLLGDLMIKNKLASNVVFVTLSQGGTSILEWIPGSANYGSVMNYTRALRNQGLEFTRVIWHQGESDSYKFKNLTGEDYKKNFLNMIHGFRGAGIIAPVYISVATVCDSFPHEEIRNAQKGLVNVKESLLAGPDTDILIPLELRSGVDRCHFSDEGINVFAREWFKIFKKEKT